MMVLTSSCAVRFCSSEEFVEIFKERARAYIHSIENIRRSDIREVLYEGKITKRKRN